MNEFMKILLSLSVSGTLLLLLIFGLKPLYKGKFSKRWQYYIWIIAALRFLLPFTPDNAVVGNLFERFDTAAVTDEISASPNISVQANDSEAKQAQSQAQEQALNQVKEQTLNQAQEQAQSQAQESIQVQAQTQIQTPESENAAASAIARNPQSVYLGLFFIWLAMALILFVRKITVYQGFIQYIKAGNTDVSDIKTLNLLSDCEEKLNIKTRVELSCNPLIASPMLIGFFKPRIVLPDCKSEDKELSYIFAHELIHYKRMDMFYKWLIQIVVCAHWFTPFVYLLEKEMNKSCELSCDEEVIHILDDKARCEYGDTLIASLKSNNLYKNSLASVTLTEGAEQLKERLGAIMNFKKKTKLLTTISIMAAVLLAVGGFSIGAYASNDSVPANQAASVPVKKTKTANALGKKVPQAPAAQNAAAYIGEAAAKNAALTHAGIKESDTHYCNSWLEYENKLPAYYEVEFMAGNIEYDYEIDLYSGTVLKCDTKYRNVQLPAKNTVNPTNTADIGQEAAKQAALNHAGLAETQVSNMKIKLDYDDGWMEYDVDFKYNGMKYEYTIDGTTGNILKYDYENSGISINPRSNNTQANASTADIGQEAAKQTALNHAGLTEAQVSRMKIELDYDDGRMEYEVDFKYNWLEYDYTIDAATGTILKYEIDND